MCQKDFIFAGVTNYSGVTSYDNALDTGRLGLGLPTKKASKMKTYID